MKKEIEKQECKRCGKTFWPKIDDESNKILLPKNCRGCNSPYWNIEKTKFK